jgi:hypothetical protein
MSDTNLTYLETQGVIRDVWNLEAKCSPKVIFLHYAQIISLVSLNIPAEEESGVCFFRAVHER